MDELKTLQDDALKQVQDACALSELEQVRVHFLGKKGLISQQMKALGQLAPEDRPAAGAQINVVRDAVAEAIDAQKAALERAEESKTLAREAIDVVCLGVLVSPVDFIL